MDKKKIVIISLSIMLVIAVSIIIFLLPGSTTSKTEVQNKIYGKVSDIKDNIVTIKDQETNRIYRVETSEELNNGDVIAVYYEKQSDTIKPTELVVLTRSSDNIILIDTTTTSTTTTTIESTTLTTVPSTTQVVTSIIETTHNTTKREGPRVTPLEYVKEEYENAKSGKLKDNFKEAFINVVDFIFYDKDFNGFKFKDLTSATKAKIVYYTLLLDGKINELKPDYKDSLKGKYQDIKGQLIASYLGITSKACQNHESTCDTLKKDFSFLKDKLSITWSFIKSAFKYGYDKSTSFLTNWYEIFSGKR